MAKMTSAERLAVALARREPDRVPLVLPAVLHGARLLGLTVERYFSRAEHVVEGQLRLCTALGNDAVLGVLYACQELEAFGGETLFREDGPPNAGAPVLRAPEDIDRLEPPRIAECPTLVRVLRIIQQLRQRTGGAVPVVGSLLSPFTLPILQMGFESYLVLMHEDPVRFERLMAVNEEFAVSWANAQLAAGADALVFVDPISSPSMIPRDRYLHTGFPIACRTLRRIHGPCAASFASAPVLPIVDLVARTGAVAVTASCTEDLAELKRRCGASLAVMGNLNAIEMRRWTADDAAFRVKAAIAAAGPGGGFVLSDNHGEIPLQVSDDTLREVAEASRRWGQYPLEWVTADER